MDFSKIRCNVAVFLTLLVPVAEEVYAASIGPDCQPKGVVAIAKEAWDSKSFWAWQIKEINDYIEGQKVAYRLALLDRRRDRANEAFTVEEMRTLGIRPASDPQLERKLANTERELAEIDRQLLLSAIAWGQKCTAFAQQKLSAMK